MAPQCSGPSCGHHEMRGSSARSSSRGSSGGSFGNLDRRTPESKKYAHIASSINTGASAKNQVVVTAGVAAKRRDEIFKRIRPATLVRMLEERNVNESIFNMGGYGSGRPDTSKSVFSSVVASKAGPLSIAGAASVASVHTVAGSLLSVVDSSATVDDTRDLVLLDLRERADFDQCHLPLAMNYPASLINRDQFTPELYRCKRDVSKLLVVYHTDDQSTAGVAMLLAQKGWDTVHAVTGGFEELAQSYPEVLEGEMPARPDTTGSAPRSAGAGRSAGTPLRGGRPPRL